MEDVKPQRQKEPLAPHHLATKRRASWRITIVAVGIVLVGALLSTIGWYWLSGDSAQSINRNEYQVVYLTNGQAYFGKLQNTTGDYLVLKTPYTAQDVKAADTSSSTPTQTTLLKVSAQVYGPEDSIAIRASQVAFWQNLRSDSKVTQAINAKQ